MLTRQRVVAVKDLPFLMAKPKPNTGIDTPSGPLHSPAGREWIEAELEKAERAEQLGPIGQGWAHNEILRPVIAERADFLRALVALLPK